jgi:hypothetical protein
MTDDDELERERCGETYIHEPHIWALYGHEGWQDRLNRQCAGVPDPRIAELTEMLTAATDTAVQRGKRIEQLEVEVACWESESDHWHDAYLLALDGVDGG